VPWRSGADEVSLSDKRIETWRSAGFATVVFLAQGRNLPVGRRPCWIWRANTRGDLVVKSPVAIPVTFQTSGGFGGGFFPARSWAPLAYIHPGLAVDTEMELSKAQVIYEKNPRSAARPRYDRTEAALAEALEDHALVLIPANNAVQLRRALELVDRWHVNGVIYGGQMAYEVAPEIAGEKTCRACESEVAGSREGC